MNVQPVCLVKWELRKVKWKIQLDKCEINESLLQSLQNIDNLLFILK